MAAQQRAGRARAYDCRGAEHLLRLALELRLREADGDDGRQTGEDVVLLDFVIADLELARVDLELLLEHLHERLLETGVVRAALRRRDDVDEAAHLRLVPRAPAQRDVDAALARHVLARHVAARFVEHRHRLGERPAALQAPDAGDGGVGREVLAELADAAVVEEGLLVGAVLPRRTGEAPLVTNDDGEARHEETRLTSARNELVVVELRGLEEDRRVGPVAHARTGDAAPGLADNLELAAGLERRERVRRALRERIGGVAVGERAGLAAAETHAVRLARTVDLDVETRTERVDDGRTDAVQTTGGRVRPATELAARVQFREDDLDARQTRARLDVDGNAAAVVAHLDGAVGQEDDLDAVAVAAERLVDRWFTLEDPSRLEPSQREVQVETQLDGLLLRGIIDRVDIAPTGQVRIVDYKTGRTPAAGFEGKALFQMKFYGLVMWRRTGRVPDLLQLVYLKDGTIVRYEPDEADLLALERNVRAVWTAIEQAVATRDFRPSPSKLCGWCDFKPLCPAFGGTPPPYPPSAPPEATASDGQDSALP